MSNAGVLVTPDRALGLSAYFAAVNRIATDVASLPLKVYRKRRGGGRDEVTDHPISELLAHSPDGETTSMRWRQALMAHILGWGNGYAEVTFDGAGYPTGLYLLDPGRTEPQRRTNDGLLYYRLTNPDPKRPTNTLPPRRVLHCAGLGFDGLKGYSVADRAKESIGLGVAAEKSGGAFYGNGTRPSGALELPYKLNSPQAVKQLRETWDSQYAGPDNVGRVVVLEGGAKFSPMSIPQDDAQYIQTRQFQVIEIARWFGIPPHKIGDYSSTGSAYRALEEANLDYVATTIRPWCESIEQELVRKLLTKDERDQGYDIEHDMSAFMRGNMQARGAYYKDLISVGGITPDEIREREGLNPLDGGGDERFVATSLQPLEGAGEAPGADAETGESPDPNDPPPAPAESIESGDTQ